MATKPTIKQFLPWAVVTSAALFFFFDFIAMSTFDAINNSISTSLSLNRFQISTLETLYFAAIVIFLMPAGVLLDRLSTRKIILFCFMAMIVATVVFAMSNNYWVIASCRFITGMVATVCLMSCIRLTSRWFEANYAGFVIGIVVTFAMLGGIVAQQLMKFDTLFGSWRHTLLIISAIGVLFWLVCCIFVKDAPKHAKAKQAQQKDALKQLGFWKSLKLATKNPQNWLAGIYTNILSIPILVMGTLWGQEYLIHAKHINHTDAANIISLVFLGMVIGAPLSGWLSDRLGRRKMPMIIGAILSFIVAMIIYLTHSQSVTYLSVLFFLLGIIPSTQVICYPYFVEVNPLHITSTSTCLGATIIMSSGFIWGLLFGWFSNKSSHLVNGKLIYPAGNFDHAFLILPITFAVAILVACFLKETRCKYIST